MKYYLTVINVEKVVIKYHANGRGQYMKEAVDKRYDEEFAI